MNTFKASPGLDGDTAEYIVESRKFGSRLMYCKLLLSVIINLTQEMLGYILMRSLDTSSNEDQYLRPVGLVGTRPPRTAKASAHFGTYIQTYLAFDLDYMTCEVEASSQIFLFKLSICNFPLQAAWRLGRWLSIHPEHIICG